MLRRCVSCFLQARKSFNGAGVVNHDGRLSCTAPAAALLHEPEHVHAIEHGAKHDMLAIQVRRGRECEEELREILHGRWGGGSKGYVENGGPTARRVG